MEQKVSSLDTICSSSIVFDLNKIDICIFMALFFLFSSWDEWVPESRVLKYVDSNLAKQKELQKANQ